MEGRGRGGWKVEVGVDGGKVECALHCLLVM